MPILGSHSVGELQWLLDSRDYFARTLGQAAFENQDYWLARDPAGAAAWGRDYLAFQQRYAVARAEAARIIAGAKDSLFGGNWQPAEEAWLGVIRAFQKIDNTTSPGDFTDLVRRARDMGTAVTFPSIPPDKSVDQELAIYQDADAAWKAVQAGVDKVASFGGGFTVGAVVVGALALYLMLGRGRR